MLNPESKYKQGSTIKLSLKKYSYHFLFFSLVLYALLPACQRINEAKPGNNLSFIKLVGGVRNEIAYDLATTHDGGYAFVASSESFAERGATNTMLLFRTDKKGNLTWRKSLGGILGRTLKRTTDNGFILIGDAVVANVDTLIYVVKTNERGDIEWSKTYRAPIEITGTGANKGMDIQIDKDQNYWILGSVINNATSTSTAYLCKIDKEGNILRERAYGFAQRFNEVAKLALTQSNNITVVGNITNNNNLPVVRMFKADSLANIKWDFEYASPRSQKATDMKALSSSYIITGTAQKDEADAGDFLILRTDLNGQTELRALVGTDNPDVAQAIIPTQDVGYITVGYTEKNEDGKRHRDILIIKTDFVGQKQWQKILGAGRDDEARGVKQLEDGTYLIFGTIGFESNRMVAIIRLDKNGNFIE